MEQPSRHHHTETFMRLQIAAGAAALLVSACRLTPAQLDFHFLLLVIITLTIGSRITVKIPRLTSHISVSDTFLLLAILLCGGEAAIILAALDGFCSTLRTSKRKQTYLLNISVMAASTFVTVWVVRLAFGLPETELHRAGVGTFVVALCLMGGTQYVVNSGLVATGLALKTGQPVWHTWRKYFLWTSITYFVGATAAGAIIKFIGWPASRRSRPPRPSSPSST